MAITRHFCYTDQDGKDIYLFRLSHADGTEALISNYGAIITAFKVKAKNGKMQDIVLGFDNMEDYLQPLYLENYPWFGAAIGRYANRIGKAMFTLNDREYKLSRNRGENNLHGGHSGFDKKIWTIVSSGDDPCPFLVLEFLSPDGDEGFPGNLKTTLRYELRENELSFEFTATTDKATPVNLTHHGYFNLDNGEGTIHDHELRIPASQYLEQYPDLVVTGNSIPVAGSPHDFRNFKKIGDGLKEVPEFDQSFVVDADHDGPVAEVRSDRSGLLLQVFSNGSVVHFYSGKWIPPVKGKRDIVYRPFSAFCLETHNYPNAVNISSFPSDILQPGETFRHKTSYKVSMY